MNQDFLSRLERIPWLSRCGHPLPTFDFETRAVDSWTSAEQSYTHPDWETVTGDAQGDIMARLHQIAPSETTRWNALAHQYRERIHTSVIPWIERTRQRQSLSSVLLDCVAWDVLHAGMETEFSRHGVGDFYRRLLKVYESGHLPVGLEGQRLQGRLRVY